MFSKTNAARLICCCCCTSVWCVRQVKTLKPLSTLKLQQLCSLTEEETFVDEQYIATEGQMGDRFYMVLAGTVSIFGGNLDLFSVRTLSAQTFLACDYCSGC